MLNERSVNYSPTPSGLTSKIYPFMATAYAIRAQKYTCESII